VIRRLAREAVPVLCEYHRDRACGYEIAHPVHAWPLQARPALSGVHYLLDDLVALAGGVLPQSF
jgi:hypothetical protein